MSVTIDQLGVAVTDQHGAIFRAQLYGRIRVFDDLEVRARDMGVELDGVRLHHVQGVELLPMRPVGSGRCRGTLLMKGTGPIRGERLVFRIHDNERERFRVVIDGCRFLQTVATEPDWAGIWLVQIVGDWRIERLS